MADKVSKECIQYAKLGDITMLKHLYETDPEVRDPYVYQRVLSNACASDQMGVVQWLLELYVAFDAVTKSALRHTLLHGKYLLKNKESRLVYADWCDLVLPPVN